MSDAGSFLSASARLIVFFAALTRTALSALSSSLLRPTRTRLGSPVSMLAMTFSSKSGHMTDVVGIKSCDASGLRLQHQCALSLLRTGAPRHERDTQFRSTPRKRHPNRRGVIIGYPSHVVGSAAVIIHPQSSLLDDLSRSSSLNTTA